MFGRKRRFARVATRPEFSDRIVAKNSGHLAVAAEDQENLVGRVEPFHAFDVISAADMDDVVDQGGDGGLDGRLGHAYFLRCLGMNQISAMPPSQRRLIPVTNLLASAARNRAAPPSSSGRPTRAGGIAPPSLPAHAPRPS